MNIKIKNLLFTLCGVGTAFYSFSLVATQQEDLSSALLVCESEEQRLQRELDVCNKTPQAGILDPMQDSRVQALRSEIRDTLLPNLRSTLGGTNVVLTTVSSSKTDALIQAVSDKKHAIKSQILKLMVQVLEKKIIYVENAFKLGRSQAVEDVEIIFKHVSFDRLSRLLSESPYKAQWRDLYVQYYNAKRDELSGLAASEEKTLRGNALLRQVAALPDTFANKAGMVSELKALGFLEGTGQGQGDVPPPPPPPPPPTENANFKKMQAGITGGSGSAISALAAASALAGEPNLGGVLAEDFNSVLANLLQQLKADLAGGKLYRSGIADNIAALEAIKGHQTNSDNEAGIDLIKGLYSVRSGLDAIIAGKDDISSQENRERLQGADKNSGLKGQLAQLRSGMPSQDAALSAELGAWSKDLEGLLGWTFGDIQSSVTKMAAYATAQLNKNPDGTGKITLQPNAIRGQALINDEYNKVLDQINQRSLSPEVRRRVLISAQKALWSHKDINAIIRALNGGTLVVGTLIKGTNAFAKVVDNSGVLQAIADFDGKAKLRDGFKVGKSTVESYRAEPTSEELAQLESLNQ